MKQETRTRIFDFLTVTTVHLAVIVAIVILDGVGR